MRLRQRNCKLWYHTTVIMNALQMFIRKLYHVFFSSISGSGRIIVKELLLNHSGSGFTCCTLELQMLDAFCTTYVKSRYP